MATPLGMFRRLNLNSSWGKCGIWLVNQWIPFSLCVFVWLGIDYTLRALICLSVMHIWLLLFLRDVHMLIMSIDPLAMIILLTLTSMFTLLYILFVLICWFFLCTILILFLACYPYCILILVILFLLSFCVNMTNILVRCIIACCMTTLLLCDARVVCLCGTHIYPLTSNSLVSVDLASFNLVFDMRLVTLFALRPS